MTAISNVGRRTSSVNQQKSYHYLAVHSRATIVAFSHLSQYGFVDEVCGDGCVAGIACRCGLGDALLKITVLAAQ
eukprot:scaffold248402_cov58-Cyclotella_meneghiniana.AAC.2